MDSIIISRHPAAVEQFIEQFPTMEQKGTLVQGFIGDYWVEVTLGGNVPVTDFSISTTSGEEDELWYSGTFYRKVNKQIRYTFVASVPKHHSMYHWGRHIGKMDVSSGNTMVYSIGCNVIVPDTIRSIIKQIFDVARYGASNKQERRG